MNAIHRYAPDSNFRSHELAKCNNDRLSQVIICRLSFAWMDLVSYKDHGGADLAKDEAGLGVRDPGARLIRDDEMQ